MFRLFECCALSFFERFVLSFSLKIERFVSDSAEIWICGLYENNRDAEYTIASRDQNFNKWNYNNKDVSVQNNRYVRLKSLVVGYSLPQKWISKAGLSKLRVYFSGDDLWEWTKVKDGYDPEYGENSNNTFPFSRLLTFGVDVTF